MYKDIHIYIRKLSWCGELFVDHPVKEVQMRELSSRKDTLLAWFSTNYYSTLRLVFHLKCHDSVFACGPCAFACGTWSSISVHIFDGVGVKGLKSVFAFGPRALVDPLFSREHRREKHEEHDQFHVLGMHVVFK